jgi:hypothetical protein
MISERQAFSAWQDVLDRLRIDLGRELDDRFDRFGREVDDRFDRFGRDLDGKLAALRHQVMAAWRRDLLVIAIPSSLL